MPNTVLNNSKIPDFVVNTRHSIQLVFKYQVFNNTAGRPTSTSDCDARTSDAASSTTEMEPAKAELGPVDHNVYLTSHGDDDGVLTLEFFARHPVRNMIVDWDMPGTASRRMIDVVHPANDVDDGYFTATIRRSFNASLPNVTRVRMSGRIEGVMFNISKGLDHARRPPNDGGIVAMLSVFPAPTGFAEDRQTAFQVGYIKLKLKADL